MVLLNTTAFIKTQQGWSSQVVSFNKLLNAQCWENNMYYQQHLCYLWVDYKYLILSKCNKIMSYVRVNYANKIKVPVRIHSFKYDWTFQGESLFSALCTLCNTVDESCSRNRTAYRKNVILRWPRSNYSVRQNPINKMEYFKYTSCLICGSACAYIIIFAFLFVRATHYFHIFCHNYSGS